MVANLSTISYLIGGGFYIAGGILSEIGVSAVYFSSMWLPGSVFFFLGATLGLIAYCKSRKD